MNNLGEVVGYKVSYSLLDRLMNHIDGQAETIQSLQEYNDALERSFIMREVTRRFELPPPG